METTRTYGVLTMYMLDALFREDCAEAGSDRRDVHELCNGGAHAHLRFGRPEGYGRGVTASEERSKSLIVSGGAVGKGYSS